MTFWLRASASFCALLAPLVLLPLAGCEPANATTEEISDVDAYPVSSATVTDTFVEREYVAEVRAAHYAEIRARLGGIVEEVAVDEGQEVEAGQHLFSIGARHLQQDVAATRAAAAATKAELEAARLEVKNSQLLFDKNVISEAPVAQAKARVEALEAKLQEWKASTGRAKAQVGYARVTAPFSGRIDRIPNKLGSVVAEDELLTTVADTSEVHAYFRMSEVDYLRHKTQLVGEKSPRVWLKLADGSRFSSPGTIDAVANEVDRETGTIVLRARFDNDSEALKHGSSGKVVLETTIPEAVLVPQASTVDVQGNLFVYVVDENDVVHAQKIVPKARLSQHFVVESGLTAADKFVLEGVQQLRDGQRIQVLEPASVAAQG